MPFSPDDMDLKLAARIRSEREARNWSLADLADRSGVSRSMINKVERNQSSPTSALLARLAAAFGMTMSTLLMRAEGGTGPGVTRAADRARWTDPATGYVRAQVFPSPGSDFPVDMVEVEMPPGERVSYPASSYAFGRNGVWVLTGELQLSLGGVTHKLEAGDAIEFGPPADCTYANTSGLPCTYVVTVSR